MYAIHTTHGFVLNSRSYGEAGKMISILTEDLGLVRAVAQGIRFEKSKLRPFVQDYTLGTYSFVKGKEYWRLTSAQGRPASRTLTPSEISILARLGVLMSRLIQGEHHHQEIYTCVAACITFLESTPNLPLHILEILESLTVVRILHRLGYIADIMDIKGDIESYEISHERLAALQAVRTKINQHINRALRESHL